MKKLITILILSSLLIGCSDISKEDVGLFFGGMAGAMAGSQFGKGDGQIATTAAGTMIGAYMGKEIAGGLQSSDINMFGEVINNSYSKPINTPTTWYNPYTGNSGYITHTHQYYTPYPPYNPHIHYNPQIYNDVYFGTNKRICREYEGSITIEGHVQKAVGAACRNPDGTWEIIK